MLHGWQYLTPEDRETILQGVVDGTVYGGPYHLELDWVDACNARCFFCNSAHTQNGKSIPWERALSLLEEAVAGGLHSIRLSGGGEPTLHPRFLDLLEFLRAHNIILDNLTTNGVHLTDVIIDALQKVKVTELRVSLNYPTAATWSQAMGLPVAVFERVTRAIRRLAEARRGNPLFGRLMIQYFIYKPTAHLIRESYEQARELGVDLVTYRELSGLDPELRLGAGDAPAVLEQMREIIRADWKTGIVESHLESHGIGDTLNAYYVALRAELGGAPPLAPREINIASRFCYIGWYSMTIMGNQAVYPCCYLFPNPSSRLLGSVEHAGLGEVWRGAGYARMRREIRDFMMLRRRVPLFERRTQQIDAFCASHFDCPLTRSMADDDFYEEAERRLALLRARPGTRAWIFLNRAGRFLERNLLGKKNY